MQLRGFTSTRPALHHRSGILHGPSSPGVGVGGAGGAGGKRPFPPPPPPPPPFTPIPLDRVVSSAAERGRLPDAPLEDLVGQYKRVSLWRFLAKLSVGILIAVIVFQVGGTVMVLWQLAKDAGEEAESALRHRDAQGWRDGGAPVGLPFLTAEDEAALEAAKTPSQRKQEAQERRELLAQLAEEQPATERALQQRSKWLASHAEVYTLGLEPPPEPSTPESSLDSLLSFIKHHPLPGSPQQFKTDQELHEQFARGTSARPDPPQLAWQLLQHVEAINTRAHFLMSHPKNWGVSDEVRWGLARELLKEVVAKRTQLIQYMHLHALRFPREMQPLSMVQVQFTALAMDLAELGRESAVERVIDGGLKPLSVLALERLEKNGKNHPHAVARTRAHCNDAIVSVVGMLCEQAKDWVEAAAYHRASLSNKLVILGLVTGDEAQAAEAEENEEASRALEIASANSQQLSFELMRLSYVEAAASQTPEAQSLPAASLLSARAQSVIHAAQAVELAQYRLMQELGPNNEAELTKFWDEEEAAEEKAIKEQTDKIEQQQRMKEQLQEELKEELAESNEDASPSLPPAAPPADAAASGPTGTPVDPIAAIAALEATAAKLRASAAAASALLSPEAALAESQLEGMFSLLNSNLPLTLDRPFLEGRVGSPPIDPASGKVVELDAAKDKLWQAQQLAEEQLAMRDSVDGALDDVMLAASLNTLRTYVAHLSSTREKERGWGLHLVLSDAVLRLQIAKIKDSLARPYAQLAQALEVQGEADKAKQARDIAETFANVDGK